MAKLVLKIIATIILLIFSPIILILVLPVYIFRFFAAHFLKHMYPGVDKILTTRSSCSAAEDFYTYSQYSLIAVSMYDDNVTIEQVRDVVQRNVIEKRLANGDLQFKEFKQYGKRKFTFKLNISQFVMLYVLPVTKKLGFSFWKWEKDFKLEEHVRYYDGKYKDLFASRMISIEEFCDAVDDLVYKPFPRKHSPWEVLVVQNIEDKESFDYTPCSALILRVHHCLGDGFSLMTFYNSALSVPIHENKSGPSFEKQKPEGNICKLICNLIKSPFEFISEVVDATDVNPWHLPKEQLKRTFNTSMSPVISMDRFKEVKNLNKTSFTAVILECFAGSLRRFMSEAGYPIPDKIHCVTPLPVPGHSEKMRNHMTACFTTLPVGIPDPKKRLESIEKDLANSRKSTLPMTLFYSMSFVGGLFRCMIPPFSKNERTTAIMSNFPGPKDLIIYGENKLLSMWFGGGLHEGNCGMGFSALSYNNGLRIVVAIDEGIVPKSKLSAKILINFFFEELDILKREADV